MIVASENPFAMLVEKQNNSCIYNTDEFLIKIYEKKRWYFIE